MTFCFDNLTIGVYDRLFHKILAIQNNIITGFVGKHYDGLYAGRKKR